MGGIVLISVVLLIVYCIVWWLEERKLKKVTHRNDHYKVEPPKAGNFSFQTSKVTYGGIDGAYYTSTRTRKTGSDGVCNLCELLLTSLCLCLGLSVSLKSLSYWPVRIGKILYGFYYFCMVLDILLLSWSYFRCVTCPLVMNNENSLGLWCYLLWVRWFWRKAEKLIRQQARQHTGYPEELMIRCIL